MVCLATVASAKVQNSDLRLVGSAILVVDLLVRSNLDQTCFADRECGLLKRIAEPHESIVPLAVPSLSIATVPVP